MIGKKPARGALLTALCLALCLTALPGTALAVAYTVPGDESSLADAIATGNATQITLQGVTDSSIDTIPSGLTVVLSGSPTIAVSGELTVSGSITGAGSISAGSVYVTRSGSVGSSVGYSGVVYWEQNIGIPGVTRIVGSDGRDMSPQATSGGYYKTTVRYPTAVYVGDDKYVATAGGFSREYKITYVSQDPNTACTNNNPTAYTAETDPFALQKPTVTYSDYTFVQWQWADGTKASIVDPSGLTGNLTIYAVWKQAASGGTAAGRTGSVAGGGSGTFAAAASATAQTSNSDDDDDDEETAAADTAATANSGFGNMRVRMASSTTRHTVHSDTETDVQALANQRASKGRFPWQWVGIGLGAAALITALGVTLKRRADEKTAAMLEKLNIKE